MGDSQLETEILDEIVEVVGDWAARRGMLQHSAPTGMLEAIASAAVIGAVDIDIFRQPEVARAADMNAVGFVPFEFIVKETRNLQEIILFAAPRRIAHRYVGMDLVGQKIRFHAV